MKNISERLLGLRTEFRAVPYFWLALLGVVSVPLFMLPWTGESAKTALALIFAGGVVWQSRNVRFTIDPKYLVILGTFLLCVCLSALAAPETWVAVWGRASRFNNSLILFAAWSALMLALAQGWNFVRQRVVWHVLLGCALIIAIFGLMQAAGIGFFGGIRSLLIPHFDRVPSLVGNPNFSAIVVASFWPAAVILALTAKSRFGFWYGWISVVVLWASIGIFASRGAMLGAGAGLVVLLVWVLRARGKKVFLGVLAALAVFIGLTVAAGYLYHPGIAVGVNVSEQNTASRLYVWSESLLMISRAPWLGTGPGGFLTEYMRSAQDPVSQDGWFDDPHNLLLHLGATLGLPAMLAFAVFLGVAGFAALRAFWKDGDNWPAAASFAGLITFTVAAMFNPVTVSLWMILAAVVAGCIASTRDAVNNKISGVFSSRVARFMVGLLGILLIIIGSLWMASEYTATLAARSYREADPDKAGKIAAWSAKLFPANINSRLVLAAGLVRGQRDLQIAGAALQYVTNKYPRDPAVQTQAARIWWMWQERGGGKEAAKQAKEAALRGLTAVPRAPDPYVVLGFIAYAEKNDEEALRWLQQAVILRRDDITAWQLIAAVQQRRGNYQAMIGALRELLRIQPRHPSYREALEVLRQNPRVEALNLQIGGMEVYF